MSRIRIPPEQAAPLADATYSSSEASAATGLSRQALLTWERRYGFPTPQRTHQGHRRYTNDDLVAISYVRAAAIRGQPLPEAILEITTGAQEWSSRSAPTPDLVMRSALDHLPVNVAIIRAPDFRYVYVNQALSKLVPGVRVGKRLEEVLKNINGTGALSRVLRTGEPWYEREEPIVIGDELRFFDAMYLRLPAIDGQPMHILATGRETTELVRAKRRLAMVEGLANSTVEAARAAAMLRTLDSLCQAVGGASRSFFKLLPERVSRDLGADGTTIALRQGSRLVPTHGVTLNNLRWHPVEWQRLPRLQEAIGSGSMIWFQASRSRARSERALLRRLIARTLCCAPIVAGGETIAVLLLRWSVNEFAPSVTTVNFVNVARRLAAIHLTAASGDDNRSPANSGHQILATADIAQEALTQPGEK
jgi:hypothetical protein